jgi:hypothetical protein
MIRRYLVAMSIALATLDYERYARIDISSQMEAFVDDLNVV